ncbi:MAG TPA: LLM class flavin-dependent oxidoreductase [Myxococcaceae bacterium]|nr:LLM class flavin-dependent oxidoreductase [Myxococcaceae bacterium]
MSPVPLSILDLSPIATGVTSARTLRNSLELARLADRLGYTRYWFAEHHNMPMIASTTPATMIALAAEATTRLRVGAGGLMLPNHAPLQVAESFKMLEALFPRRIDLGIGRAPGTDPVTAMALRRTEDTFGTEDDFPEQLAHLLAFDQGNFPDGHPFRSVRAMPDDVALPPIWLLGSSGYSARLAAMLGRGFGFAAHFSPEPPEGPMLAYRHGFRSGGALEQPHAILTVSVICADTTAEARGLAASMELTWAKLRSGRPGKLASPEEALAHPYSPVERAAIEAYRQMQIVGDPPTVKARIDALVARTRADEVMVTTATHDPAARLRSYELLAREHGLTAPDSAGAPSVS